MNLKIPKELQGKIAIIYFLKYKGKVVYIGESSVGLARTFHHTYDKKFDEVDVLPAPYNKNDRLLLEEKYIFEYLPKYNKIENHYANLMRRKGFINIEIIRKFLKNKYGEFAYELTGSFKFLIKQHCEYQYNNAVLYAKKEDLAVLINSYGFTINF